MSWSLGGHHPDLSQGAHPRKFQFYAYFVLILGVVAKGLLEIKGSRPHLLPRYHHLTIANGGRGLGMCHVRSIKWTTLIIVSVPFSSHPHHRLQDSFHLPEPNSVRIKR